MRFLPSFLGLSTLAFLSSASWAAESPRHAVSGQAVIREMNLARQQPGVYAGYLEAQRAHFQGNILLLPSGARLRTKEGVGAIDDAIRFLRNARPLGPLMASPGMARAAAEHVADQLNGSYGHGGSDRSNPAARLNRYGVWSVHWGENISYGKSTARDIVMALIIDDGQRGRKHRKNIFNPDFNYAGAAVGPHARYRTVCSIDFAGGYAEHRDFDDSPRLVGN